MTLPDGTGAEETSPLIPEIPDDLTLSLIATKLSWRDLHSLSSVSRGWSHVIHSRQVFDERVRAHSTEELVLVNYVRSQKIEIAIYSMRENSAYQLPPIPGLEGGIPRYCQCVSLDGRIYVLGGYVDSAGGLRSGEVYLLDIAAQGRWTKCANMREARGRFGCGVLDVKIYVCGGTSTHELVQGSEVYDPKSNTWSAITRMKSLRFDHDVATVGKELVVHGGKVLDPPCKNEVFRPAALIAKKGTVVSEHLQGDVSVQDARYFGWTKQWTRDRIPLNCRVYVMRARSVEIYDPIKDEWREGWTEMSRPSYHPPNIGFVARGNFHAWNEVLGIYIRDFEEKSWRYKQSCPFYAEGPGCRLIVTAVDSVVAVDGELLALMECDNPIGYSDGISLYQSSGFEGEDEDIVWQKAPCPLISSHWPLDHTRYFLCPIHL